MRNGSAWTTPIAPAPDAVAACGCWRRWRSAHCKPLNAWPMRWPPGSAAESSFHFLSMSDPSMTTTGTMTSTRTLSYIALFAAVIAVFGLIPKIDLPFGVPITLQSLGIMLVGCLLGPKRAFYTIGLFLVAAFLSSVIGGILAMYLFGILGLMLAAYLTLVQASLAVLAFIPGDLVKCVICAVLVQSVVRGMPAWRLDRD